MMHEVAHRDDVDPAVRAWWDDICHQTASAMQDHCMRYVTPISHAITNDEGELEGTGSYIELAGKRLLITNEHVLRDWKTRQFAHQYYGCEDVFRLSAPIALEAHPVDAAICLIDDDRWGMRPHASEAVTPSCFAPKHQPVPGELLFFTGYPAKRSRFLFGNLLSHATRLVTQEQPVPPIADLHPNYFTLAYAPEKTQSIDPANAVPLSIPHGLSGSLVWNTRRVECLAEKKQWSPELARVTGMLCRWDSPTSRLLALRVEVLQDFLAARS